MMNELTKTAHALVIGDKGVLAMDESSPTANKRLTAAGIPQMVETRRAYRALVMTTPRLGEIISRAIFYEETIRQETKAGVSFVDALKQAGTIRG